jgi:hypothetical protein
MGERLSELPGDVGQWSNDSSAVPPRVSGLKTLEISIPQTTIRDNFEKIADG